MDETNNSSRRPPQPQRVLPVFREQLPHTSGAEVILDATLQQSANRRGQKTIGAVLAVDLVFPPADELPPAADADVDADADP